MLEFLLFADILLLLPSQLRLLGFDKRLPQLRWAMQGRSIRRSSSALRPASSGVLQFRPKKEIPLPAAAAQGIFRFAPTTRCMGCRAGHPFAGFPTDQGRLLKTGVSNRRVLDAQRGCSSVYSAAPIFAYRTA